jgi:4-diphosphocytidyl-2-C-methyl-D-erythritol kinase
MHASPRAKVNLTLSVAPRRADGYHPLRSVFLRVGLADELVVGPAPGQGGDLLTVGGLPGCPVEGNIVLRAFAAARRELGHHLPGLVTHLDKRIPLGAGLGGGSSDGASAVDAALAVWGAGLAPAALAELALELGADVPFFAHGGPVALIGGRGEQVDRLPAIGGEMGMLLVTPPFSLSTAQVFARFDELGGSMASASVCDDLAGALRGGLSGDELVAWAARLRDANDLWPAAASLAPQLATLRDTLETLTSQPWLLSGSGSTLFALYPSPAAAAEAGRTVVSAASDSVAGAIINAVDLIGPDPTWRFP